MKNKWNTLSKLLILILLINNFFSLETKSSEQSLYINEEYKHTINKRQRVYSEDNSRSNNNIPQNNSTEVSSKKSNNFFNMDTTKSQQSFSTSINEEYKDKINKIQMVCSEDNSRNNNINQYSSTAISSKKSNNKKKSHENSESTLKTIVKKKSKPFNWKQCLYFLSSANHV